MSSAPDAPSRDRTSPEPDRDAIEQLVADAGQAQYDVDALSALHLPDSIVVNAPGRRVLGRDAFADAMRAALATPLRDVATSLETVDIRFVTDDVALVSCVKTIEDRRPSETAPPLPASRGALTYVAARSGPAWRIALAQTTPILAPATES